MKFRPLSKLELEVMKVIWDCGECRIGDIIAQINKTRPLAYTTISTVVTRLTEKGAIKKHGKRPFTIYVSALSKEDMSTTVAQSFFTKFIRSFGDAAIASFAQSVDRLPKKKRDYFIELLEQYEKEGK